MTEKQEKWLIAEVMGTMKLTENQQHIAKRYVTRAVDKVLIYCNREDLPERLLSTVAMIAEDMLRADQVVESDKEVASITRGDTSISYRDDSGKQEATTTFMKDYQNTLNRFRKMNLPKDVRHD